MPKQTKEYEGTRSQAMEAMCHQCMGYYTDGKMDCECTSCPLYPWMPYAKKNPDWEWVKINPRRKGKHKKSKSQLRKEGRRRKGRRKPGPKKGTFPGTRPQDMDEKEDK